MPSLRLGYTAPDFEAETTAGRIKFHEFIGNNWVRLVPPRHTFFMRTHRPGPRWSCSHTPVTSLLCARPSSGKSLGAQKTSQSETSKSSVFLLTGCKATTTGSRISTTMEPRSALLTCNSLSCVVQYLIFRRGILISNADRR